MSTTLKVTKKRTTTTTAGKTATPTEAIAPVDVIVPPTDETTAPKKIVKKKTTPATEETVKAVKTTTKKTTTPAVEEKAEPIIVQEMIDDGNVIRTEIKKKRIATRETVLNSFDSICQSIIDEITNSKEDKNVNGKSLKFLRNINKNLGSLKKDAGKLIRQKKKTSADGTTVEKDLNNTNKLTSGFLKPVPISNAMAQFTGWAPSELKSRVEVTKFLCSYIKDNNLQNPEDRRQILADSKLAKLLDYKNGTPLTYFDMQSHLKKHFPKAVQV
jgi:chromatin remodeling complex protein RSC6